ncbi:unnamed protein product [Lactuca saligna]|uniref:Uncharacterized protein n=1 Tax=Lactuca saligna TaxID=75948 RepID=A0AA35ZVS3_LACSI|nr:unnamed protein product [Lactuca saligna]
MTSSNHPSPHKSLSFKTKKVKVLTVKPEIFEKQVNELLSEKAAMKSYIVDVTGMLSDIIENHDSIIMIMVKMPLAEKLRPIFAMLHRLEGVLESSSILKQGGEGVPLSKKEDPKPSAKHTVKSKSEPKGKRKTFQ